jgi:hypothetical protein
MYLKLPVKTEIPSNGLKIFAAQCQMYVMAGGASIPGAIFLSVFSNCKYKRGICIGNFD